ncbi:hypothetical protein G7059_00995 [Erysipelothrix sp. HDW6A]|uniref:hypothetical protein n=1 Tax=Erysipelothrix sp. HDW6A TaxID=2714928 RepID=UPI001408A14C|nr:hypothetical protein [Erysipelothrix sp. HDW6A]QIK56515.1 hypothetical protein G7059_00995 [Erysipelothrix sp. HDW6A]
MEKKRSLLSDLLILSVIILVVLGVLEIKKHFEPVDYAETFSVVGEQGKKLEHEKLGGYSMGDRSDDSNLETFIHIGDIRNNNVSFYKSVLDKDDNTGLNMKKLSMYSYNMDDDSHEKIIDIEREAMMFIKQLDDGSRFLYKYDFIINKNEDIEDDETFKQIDFKERVSFYIQLPGKEIEKLEIKTEDDSSLVINYLDLLTDGRSIYYYSREQTSKDTFKLSLVKLVGDMLTSLSSKTCTVIDDKDAFHIQIECDNGYITNSNSLYLSDKFIIDLETSDKISKIHFYNHDDSKLSNTITIDRKIERVYYDPKTESLLYISNNNGFDMNRFYRYDIKTKEEFQLDKMPNLNADEIVSSYSDGVLYFIKNYSNTLYAYDFKENTLYRQETYIKEDTSVYLSTYQDNVYLVSQEYNEIVYNIFNVKN